MVLCRYCNQEVHYKNRFVNICPNCNNIITHICWNCTKEIDPTHPEAIESPVTHFHRCPNCHRYAEHENEEELKNIEMDSLRYIFYNHWDKIFDVKDLAKLHQLVINLQYKRNIKYFCMNDVASGKTKNHLLKFFKGIQKNKEEYIDKFNKILIFIQDKEIGAEFVATTLKESIISNTENILFLDYFICYGFLQKTHLKPATFKVISHEGKKCKFHIDNIKNFCPSCGKEYDSDVKECSICVKGKRKKKNVVLKQQKIESMCTYTNLIAKYIQEDEKEDDDDRFNRDG
jgi:hypothetical protein